MKALAKNVHEPLTRVQVLARVSRSGRGRQIWGSLGMDPPLSSREILALQQELETLVTAENQRDIAAAHARGAFHREPGPRQQSATVFKGDDGFNKIMTAAMEGK